jgi:hypothetical protein
MDISKSKEEARLEKLPSPGIRVADLTRLLPIGDFATDLDEPMKELTQIRTSSAMNHAE